MTILIICLFIAMVLPIVAKIPVAIAMNNAGGYDNNHPRAQQAKLTGFGARALAAHQNAFESLIFFAPAVLLAVATGNSSVLVTQLAIVHVVARVLYNIMYLLDYGLMRSLVWGVGFFSSIVIAYQCIPTQP
ncbi:MAPEG family protein [Thalassotalea atypica]|uniref:MAPEG family protein n=1 Tax=Thalassotalea atypica TaxID=2054316 RepID=UPI0025745551|nr:MAPEG family protein [Thalassotalea atypica]